MNIEDNSATRSSGDAAELQPVGPGPDNSAYARVPGASAGCAIGRA